MARKPLLKKPNSNIYKGWTFVLVLSGILTAIALIHQTWVNYERYTTPGDGSTGCRVAVKLDGTKVLEQPRPDAEVIITLRISNPVLDAEPGLTGTYRELVVGGWVDNTRLTIVSGSTC